MVQDRVTLEEVDDQSEVPTKTNSDWGDHARKGGRLADCDLVIGVVDPLLQPAPVGEIVAGCCEILLFGDSEVRDGAYVAFGDAGPAGDLAQLQSKWPRATDCRGGQLEGVSAFRLASESVSRLP